MIHNINKECSLMLTGMASSAHPSPELSLNSLHCLVHVALRSLLLSTCNKWICNYPSTDYCLCQCDRYLFRFCLPNKSCAGESLELRLLKDSS